MDKKLINCFVPINGKDHITKTNKSSEMKHYLEIGERLNLQQIETVFRRFKMCPKCKSTIGVWLGSKRDRAYVQCKNCGEKFELFEVFAFGEKNEMFERSRFLRK